ncbi:MAG: bifunctional phosphoribosylaminoimidazolecarboxamide formyltransferase/IMP cyclohydrolase, partial [Flavobacteriaceae bacterium]
MSTSKKASTALISVYHKEGLEPLVRKMDDLGITIYSTGGTERFINELGVEVIPVEEVTSYPSILGGRVKTLHPKVFGGILNRQDHESDVAQLEEYDIPQLDIVIVDLYPFEKTVAEGAAEQEIIEKIDIGGISLIRAAAKNYKDVLCVSSMDDYESFLKIISDGRGETSLEERKSFARKAFNVSSHYDTAIYKYFDKNNDPGTFKISELRSKQLR